MIQFGHTILRQAEVIETKVCHDGYAICWTWNAKNSRYFYKWGFVCLFVCFFWHYKPNKPNEVPVFNAMSKI